MQANNIVDWRNRVLDRDQHQCQECKAIDIKLQAHHKKRVKGFPELKLETDNGITFCIPCHVKVEREMGIQPALFLWDGGRHPEYYPHVDPWHYSRRAMNLGRM